MSETVKQLTKEDAEFLHEASTLDAEKDKSNEHVVAARELALEAGATQPGSFHIEVRDESTGEKQVVDVKNIGNFAVGQEIVDDQNSRVDNWQVGKE